MRVLRIHHLIPLFVMLDELVLPHGRPRGGRPPVLRDSEVLTILAFNLLTVQQPTLKQVYVWARQYHAGDFPKLPTYQNFVRHCHRLVPELERCLRLLFSRTAPLRFMDSTMLEVCRLVRRSTHRVAKGYATTGHNGRTLRVQAAHEH